MPTLAGQAGSQGEILKDEPKKRVAKTSVSNTELKVQIHKMLDDAGKVLERTGKDIKALQAKVAIVTKHSAGGKPDKSESAAE